MKNPVLWDVTQRGSSKNRRLGGTYHLHHQGNNSRRARNNLNSNLQPKQFFAVRLHKHDIWHEECYVFVKDKASLKKKKLRGFLVPKHTISTQGRRCSLKLEPLLRVEMCHVRATGFHIANLYFLDWSR
jgi:hypothetical protein